MKNLVLPALNSLTKSKNVASAGVIFPDSSITCTFYICSETGLQASKLPDMYSANSGLIPVKRICALGSEFE